MPAPVMPRFVGTMAAGVALAATIAAAAHPADTASSSRLDPRLSAAAVTGSNLTSAISQADGVGSQIASATLRNLADDPKAGSKTGSKTGSKGESADAAAPRAVKASDVIKLAKKQVGISETNGYGGGTKFQKWYAKSDRAKVTVKRDGGSLSGYKNAAWCSIFISWLGDQLHFSDQMGSDAWTVAHAEWFKKHGRWGHKPKPGAVVFFSWSGGGIDGIDHVGLVVKKLGGGRIKTIEGNIGDSVTKQVRSTASVVGYGYPDYAK